MVTTYALTEKLVDNTLELSLKSYIILSSDTNTCSCKVLVIEACDDHSLSPADRYMMIKHLCQAKIGLM